MSFHIKDDFSERDTILAVPASWFNSVAKFLNTLSVRGGVTLEKPHNPSKLDPVVLEIPEQVPVSDGGSDIELSDAPPKDVATTATAGTSATAARADHVHKGVQLSSATPKDVAASAAVGTATDVARADHVHKGSPLAPAPASAHATQPAFWGEFSGASGGGSAPSTFSWVALGVSGHVSGQGLYLNIVSRVYIDNSKTTPNLLAEQRRLRFSEDGRLLSVSTAYEYIISPTIQV